VSLNTTNDRKTSPRTLRPKGYSLGQRQKRNKTIIKNKKKSGNRDTKSPDEICRPDFSSSSMVTGQVAWWCVGRERRPKPCIFPVHKVLLVREREMSPYPHGLPKRNGYRGHFR
jgi:hypothetical protein